MGKNFLTLWNNVKSETTSKEEAREWFWGVFTVNKLITEMIMELAVFYGVVQQHENERFATFEIKLTNLVGCHLGIHSIANYHFQRE